MPAADWERVNSSLLNEVSLLFSPTSIVFVLPELAIATETFAVLALSVAPEVPPLPVEPLPVLEDPLSHEELPVTVTPMALVLLPRPNVIVLPPV